MCCKIHLLPLVNILKSCLSTLCLLYRPRATVVSLLKQKLSQICCISFILSKAFYQPHILFHSLLFGLVKSAAIFQARKVVADIWHLSSVFIKNVYKPLQPKTSWFLFVGQQQTKYLQPPIQSVIKILQNLTSIFLFVFFETSSLYFEVQR